MMKIFKLFVFLSCFCAADNVFAQTPQAVESDLLKRFNKIEYWGKHQNDTGVNTDGADSLFKANKSFQSKLKHYAAKCPFTFTQKFDSLKNLYIITSDDNLLRVYTWDDRTSDVMHYYKSVMQFKNADTLVSLTTSEALFTNIYTLTGGKNTYYLMVYYKNIGSGYEARGVKVWAIEDGQLNKKVNLFVTGQDMVNLIHYAYWADPQVNGNIIFNKKAKTLSIPATTKNGRLTGSRITYRFTGEYFVATGP
jgi:hypothetical protein